METVKVMKKDEKHVTFRVKVNDVCTYDVDINAVNILGSTAFVLTMDGKVSNHESIVDVLNVIKFNVGSESFKEVVKAIA